MAEGAAFLRAGLCILRQRWYDKTGCRGEGAAVAPIEKDSTYSKAERNAIIMLLLKM